MTALTVELRALLAEMKAARFAECEEIGARMAQFVQRNGDELLAALSERGGEPVAFAVLSTHNGEEQQTDLFLKAADAEAWQQNNGGVTIPLGPLGGITIARPQAGQEFAYLDSEDFYNVCQAYRHAGDPFPKHEGLPSAAEAFETLKAYIRTQGGSHV